MLRRRETKASLIGLGFRHDERSGRQLFLFRSRERWDQRVDILHRLGGIDDEELLLAGLLVEGERLGVGRQPLRAARGDPVVAAIDVRRGEERLPDAARTARDDIQVAVAIAFDLHADLVAGAEHRGRADFLLAAVHHLHERIAESERLLGGAVRCVDDARRLGLPW